MNERDQVCKDVIGMSLDHALFYIGLKGYTCRVTCMDGNYTVCTRDLNLNRIGLVIVKGIVKEARVG